MKSELLTWIEKAVKEREAEILEANDKIWGYAELPYEEEKSSALLCGMLGFLPPLWQERKREMENRWWEFWESLTHCQA